MPKVSMTVNGRPVSGEVEGRTLLVEFIRETLRLTGTHVGCDTAQCGACVVHLDGAPVKSCNVFALDLAGCGATVHGHRYLRHCYLPGCRVRFDGLARLLVASACAPESGGRFRAECGAEIAAKPTGFWS